jgi:hypothetical protein
LVLEASIGSIFASCNWFAIKLHWLLLIISALQLHKIPLSHHLQHSNTSAGCSVPFDSSLMDEYILFGAFLFMNSFPFLTLNHFTGTSDLSCSYVVDVLYVLRCSYSQIKLIFESLYQLHSV